MSAVVAHHAKAGRDQRLIEWFRKWRRPIRSWLNKRGVPAAEIDDLAQEVFIRLLRYGDDIVVDNPAGYLFRIASNVANEWSERFRVKKPHDADWLDDILIDDAHEPESIVAHDRLIAHVRAVCDTLPPRTRQILIMHVDHGMTYRQVAQHLGLTYRIVLRELSRAYSTLRMRLQIEELH